MAASPSGLATDDPDLVLHRRLLEKDATASTDLAVRFLDRLIAWVIGKNRRLDPHICSTAAEDAILALIKNAASFNPMRGKSLFSYLCMSAQGDLQNSLRPKGRLVNILSLGVELSQQAGKDLGRRDDAATQLILKEAITQADETILATARDGLTTEELAALELMLNGERKTSAFALALKVEHKSKSEQKVYVKRAKDKLKTRLKRAKAKDGGAS